VGGRAAWALSGKTGEAADFFLAEIAITLGQAACAAFDPRRALMTGWADDPAFFGAYAYAVPGAADARATLKTPLWDGRLLFAGEACDTDGLAGTVAGAYISGRLAAQKILHGFTRRGNSV
jgi:monoamine oxidase